VSAEQTEGADDEGASQPEISAPEQAAEEIVSSTPTPALRADPPRKGEGVEVAESSGDTAAEEPKPILLWRPGRFDRPAGGRRHDNRHRRAHDQADGESGGRQHQGGRPLFQGRREAKDGEARQKFAGGKGRPDGGRPDFRKGKQRDGKDGERGQPKPAFQVRPPREERPAKIDPLSPFAKLAALRDQLKK
jgi:ATP-dependent RNA helicase SUPV3L1/SUV3